MKFSSIAFAALVFLTAKSPGQLIFSASVPAPGGGTTTALFREQNGQVTQVNTGVQGVFLPKLSRDGRFITFSGVDPQRPNQASADLFLYDRATGGAATTLIDNTARQNSDGSINTIQPLFSALSPSNSVVVVTQLIATISAQGGGALSFLEVHPINPANATDFQLVEISTGQQANLYSSEFVGFSWLPDGSFATSAAIAIPTVGGAVTSLPGIILYSPGAQGWQRSAQLTQPTNTNGVDNFQIYPAFSPNSQRLAFFNITASPLINVPAQATLVVANANGSEAEALITFDAGFYPGGLTWSADGGQIIFSIGNQSSEPSGLGTSVWPASVNPDTAVVRAINSNGGNVFQLNGVNSGFSPSVVLSSSGNSGNPGSIRQAPLSLTQRAEGGFLLRASGLDPEGNYQLESSTDLRTFGNSHNFTGAEIMDGISIPDEGRKFFRVRNPSP